MKQLTNLGTIAALFLAAAMAQSSNSAEVQLKAAMHKEMVDGNLPAAIEQYRKLLKGPGLSRADAAKALLHLGQCYEKQGNAEARKAYEQLVRDYGDQKEEVNEARGRLATLSQSSVVSAGFTSRVVWSGGEVDTTGSVSADGRYLSYVHWDTGDLAIRDLATGANRIITHDATWEKESVYADLNAISPDGKQIAYIWDNKDVPELRVINTDGTGMRVLRSGGQWFRPYAWSADRKFILAEVPLSESRTQIAWIAAGDGNMRVLKTLDVDHYRDRLVLSPDSRYVAYNRPHAGGRTDRDIFILSVADGSETPLLNDPADEYVLGWSPDGRHILFASDRLGSNSAYLVPISEGKAQGPPQLVRRDIGKAVPMGFTHAGAFYFGFRGGQERTSVELYSAGLDPTTGKVVTAPEPAAQSISGSNGNGFFSPDGRYLAYRHGWPHKIEVIVLPLSGGEPRMLHPSLAAWALRGWRPDGKSLLLAGRPDNTWEGQGAYSLNLATADTSPLVLGQGQQLSLPTWSADGKTLIYDVGRKVSARDMATGQTRLLYESSDPVLRIAASGYGRYVAVANRKLIALVPFAGGESREVLHMKDGESITGWTLAWMPDSRFLVFGKRRGEKTELWRVSVETGQAEDLGLKLDDIEYISIAPDGRRISFESAIKAKTEVWSMDNFLSTH